MTWMVLFQNIWFRRAAAVVACVAACGLVREHYVRLGEQRGQQTETLRAADDAQAAQASERKEVVAAIGELKAKIGAMDAQSEAARVRAKAAADAATTAKASGDAVAASVAAIPAEALHAANVKALGGGSAEAETYSEEQERGIASCLAEKPACESETKALGEERDALEEQVASVQRARVLQQQQTAAVTEYAGTLERNYTSLYNALEATKRRNWLVTVVTFGMKGKRKKLAVPRLEELKSGKVEAGS